ncbi:uncharacterized protein LOC144913823 isoform X1 [Branchiostoma floridae x Branchiostoma belcheri]
MVGTEAGGTVVSERVSESFTWRRLQSVHLCPSCQSWGSCRILASILRDTPPLAHFLLTDVQWSAHLCYEPITGVKQVEAVIPVEWRGGGFVDGDQARVKYNSWHAPTEHANELLDPVLRAAASHVTGYSNS